MIFQLIMGEIKYQVVTTNPFTLKRPQILTAEKKALALFLPFLRELSVETRTKL